MHETFSLVEKLSAPDNYGIQKSRGRNIDRIFGIDVNDALLVEQLSGQLWTAQSNQLVEEAMRIRQS